jgi:hypothetical protein
VDGIQAYLMSSHSEQKTAIPTHYLVVAKVRERWAASKQRSHRFHTERFNLKKLSNTEGNDQYRVETEKDSWFENLDAGMDSNRAWETIRHNIKI